MYQSFFEKKTHNYSLYFAVGILILGIIWFKHEPQSFSASPQLSNYNFKQLSQYFSELAKDKGADHAFAALADVANQALLPANTDTHLLGHVVGDELYKQQGVDGITICSHDFRNACSHSIVVGLFQDQGESALSDIAQACHQAPGGRGAYTMCFHGLGHGILSYTGYDMEKTVEICLKTSEQQDKGEATQCIGGAVMEIISGGFHDRHLWEAQRPKYLNKQNPLSLCQNSFMPDRAKAMCYNYITPYLFEAVGASQARPSTEDFDSAFEHCKSIPQDSFRYSCFGGFGKEFDVLVQDRVITVDAFTNISSERLTQVYEWCLLADDRKGIDACISQAMSSLYWGGENDRSVSIRFCNVVEDNEFRQGCFSKLISAVGYYIPESSYRRNFCSEIPKEFTTECHSKLDIKI
jgi:hypothetical protein